MASEMLAFTLSSEAIYRLALTKRFRKERKEKIGLIFRLAASSYARDYACRHSLRYLSHCFDGNSAATGGSGSYSRWTWPRSICLSHLCTTQSAGKRG